MVCLLTLVSCVPNHVCLFVSLIGTACLNVLVKRCIKILWLEQYIFHDALEYPCQTTWCHLYFTQLVMHPHSLPLAPSLFLKQRGRDTTRANQARYAARFLRTKWRPSAIELGSITNVSLSLSLYDGSHSA